MKLKKSRIVPCCHLPVPILLLPAPTEAVPCTDPVLVCMDHVPAKDRNKNYTLLIDATSKTLQLPSYHSHHTIITVVSSREHHCSQGCTWLWDQPCSSALDKQKQPSLTAVVNQEIFTSQ